MPPRTGRKGPPYWDNWQALLCLAQAHLAGLYKEHPDWNVEDVIAHLKLPSTNLVVKLVHEAGFKDRSDPVPEEVCAVAAAWMTGLRGAAEISGKTGIPLERVQKIVETSGQRYGVAPYGSAPYGGNHQFSDGTNAVPRRVSLAGQLWYRGQLYTLGKAYGGRKAMIRERGKQLVAEFKGCPARSLTRRDF